MGISVIIATFNRAKQLAFVLPSYQSQKDIKEILIVDDVSTDNTEKMVRDLMRKDKRILYIKNKNRSGACATKNNGLKKATGDYIFFGEDDLELEGNFMEVLLDHLNKNKADIIAGRRIWPHPNETKEQSYLRTNKKTNSPVYYKFLLTDCETNIKDDEEVYLLDSSMLLTRKAAKSLLWDSELFKDPIAWRSESDLQLTAAEKGYKMIFCPHASAYHLPKHGNEVSKWNYLKYDLLVFKNNFNLVLKHKKFLSEKLNIKNPFFFNIWFILDRINRRYIQVIRYVVSTKLRSYFSS